MKISADEILAALRDFHAPPERPKGAFTIEEAMVSAGVGRTAMQSKVRELHRAGRVELVRFHIEALNGKMVPTIGYRIKKAGR